MKDNVRGAKKNITVLAATVLLMVVSMHEAPSHILVTADPAHGPAMQAARLAGIRRDRGKIPELIQTVVDRRTPWQENLIALHALAQIGATDALPAIEGLIARLGAIDEASQFARSARARLVAEAAARDITDPIRQANTRLSTFYKELGLSIDQINKGVSDFYGPKGQGMGPKPIEVFAMRDLADMLYLGPYTAHNGAPGIIGVDFSLDYPSEVKVHMARLTHQQRIEWIVPDLAHQNSQADGQYYEMQLAVDEGRDIAPAIGEQLRFMDTRRSEYSFMGFVMLFRVLQALDNPGQDWVWGHFSHDSDIHIAQYAKAGHRPLPFVYGY